MSSAIRLPGISAVALVALLSASVPALGQTSSPSARPGPPATNKPWTIEGYGGFALGRFTWGGSHALPDPGVPIATSNPVFPSWQVPSWFFGDGAAFLNNVNADFGLTQRVTPLDAALASAGLATAGAPFFGVRIRRHVASRLAVEGSVDVMAASARLTGDLDSAVLATRSSFESAFAALLATGPALGATVSTTSAVTGGTSREVVVSGAIEYQFNPIGRFVPYVVGGGGIITETGDLPAVTISGNYRFTVVGVSGAVPFNETDSVTLRQEQGTAFVAVGGGGLRRDFSDRWGLQVDARAFVGQNTTRLLIDANPTRVTGTPVGFIESFTYPNLQFSNNPSTGRQSTLSGSLQGFEATSGGWQTRVRLTIGVFTRF